MLKEFNKDIDYYSVLGFQNVTVDENGNCSFDVDKMWVDKQQGKYIEEDTFEFGGIVFDAEIDYTGYDSLESAVNSLKEYTSSKYNMYEAIDTEDIKEAEDEIVSPVMKGEYKWTYEYSDEESEELPDQIWNALDCFNDWGFTESEQEEKRIKEREKLISECSKQNVRVTNESILKNWGYSDDDIEELKYSFLFYNEFWKDGDIGQYELSIIDKSYRDSTVRRYAGYDEEREYTCRYFGIVDESGLTLIVADIKDYNDSPCFNFDVLEIDYE